MAKFKKSDYKKHQNMYSIMGKIGDIIFYPVIIITLICCAVIFTAKNEHKVPSILGLSMVNISSGSMTAAGFEKNDIVFLTKKNPEVLRAGDIIAFYYTSSGVSKSNLTLIQSYDMKKQEVSKTFDDKTFKDLRDNERTIKLKNINDISKNTDIYFHRIKNVYMAKDGTLFYETQGDSNATADGLLVAESLVVGKYLYTPQFLRSVFHFVSTSTGMMVMIVAPLAILMLFMLFSIIEQVSKLSLEGRVLRREVRYDDPECIKANIGIEMEPSDKAKFYATTDLDERNAVANFLWGYMSENPKDALTYKGIMHALTYIDEDPNKYWLYFLGTSQGKRQKKLLHKAWQEWIQEEKIKSLTRTSQKDTPKTTSKGEIIDGKVAPKRPQRENNERKN